MGRQALLSYHNGKKRKGNDTKKVVFLRQRELKLLLARQLRLILHVTSPESVFTHAKFCSSKIQASLELVLKNSEKAKAEIIWALKSITAWYSNKSFFDDSALFQIMFPKIKITRSFQMGPTS